MYTKVISRTYNAVAYYKVERMVLLVFFMAGMFSALVLSSFYSVVCIYSQELLRVLKKGSNPQEEKSDLYEEKKNPQEEKTNLQEEKRNPQEEKANRQLRLEPSKLF